MPQLVVLGFIALALGALFGVLGTILLALNSSRQSQKIAELNAQIAGSVTGGDSFCYLIPRFAFERINTLVFDLVHNGGYPVFDLSVTIWDDTCLERIDHGQLYEKHFGYRQRVVTQEEFAAMQKDLDFHRRNAEFTAEEFQLMRGCRLVQQHLGTVTRNPRTNVLDSPLLSWTLPEGAELRTLSQKYTVEFSARNGRVVQTVTIDSRNGRPHLHSLVERVLSESNRVVVRELESLDGPGFPIKIVK